MQTTNSFYRHMALSWTACKGRNTGCLGGHQQLQPIRNSDSEMVRGKPCSQSPWDMDGMIWTHREQTK